jgi:C-terminal processing protease CtpA/Prc
MSVNQDGPAAKAGMKAGDVITMVDGKDVEGAFNLLRALGNKDQTELNLTIIRDKAQQTIKVTPEHMNDAPSSFSPEMGFPPEVGELALPEMNLPPMPQMDVLMPRVEMNLQNFNLPALKMNQMVLPPMEVNPKIKSVRPLPPIML